MLPKLSVKKPFIVVVAVILVLILGVVSYLNLNVDLLPEMELPYVVVMTPYPGASPDQVDQNVTHPLESALSLTSGLKNTTSTSNENYSMIVLEFSADMNMDSAMIELSSYLDAAAADFPEGVASPTLLRINPSMLPVMIMTADKDGMEEAAFTDYAKNTLVPALERIDGVASVSLMGGVSEKLEIAWDRPAIDDLNARILRAVDSRLADAQAELARARADLERGKAELESRTQDAYRELADLSTQLGDGRLQVQLGLNTLEGTPAELEAKRQELLSTKQTLSMVLELLTTLEEIDLGTKQFQAAYDAIDEQLEALDEAEETLRHRKRGLHRALLAFREDPSEENSAALQAQLLAAGDDLADLLPSLGEWAEDLYELVNALEAQGLAALLETDPAAGEALAERTVAGLELALSGLDQAEDLLLRQREEIEAGQARLEGYREQIIQALGDRMGMDKAGVEEAIDQIDEGVYQIDKALAEMPGTKYQLEETLDQLTEGQKELEVGKMAASTQLSTATVQLVMGEAQLEQAEAEFEAAREAAFKNAGLDGVLTTEMLSGILTASNFSMPAGYLQGEDSSILVKVGDPFASLEEMENLLLMDLEAGEIGPVYLDDVADLAFTNDAGTYYARVNGNPGLILTVSKQSMASTNQVSKAVNAAMEDLMEKEEGLHLVALSDQGFYIRIAVDAVMDNLLIGAALAVLVLLLFLRDLRPTLVVALSIPISLLFALALMYFSGVSLNVISLAGLATGVGMLVDNSIVVIENISRLRSQGVPPATAAVQGARQVSGAIAASTLTTVCVFLPIVFTHGLSRQLFVDMGLTVAYSLLASLLVALTLAPMMGATLLKKPMKPASRPFRWLLKGYGGLLGWTLRHKWLVFLLVAAMAVFAGLGVGAQGTAFIPDVDYGQVTAVISAPEGRALSKTEIQDAATELTERVMAIPGVTMVGAMEGAGQGAGLNLMGGSGSSEQNYTLTLYVLCDYEAGLTGRAAARQIRELAKDLPVSCEVESVTMDMSALSGSGVAVTLYGEDGQVLAELAGQVSETLSRVEGIRQVEDGLEETATELRITVDKNAAMKHGLTVAQVFMELSGKLQQETQAMTLSLADKDYPVVIVDRGQADFDSAAVRGYTFTLEKTDENGETSEEKVRLSSIARVEEAQALASINRDNQKRCYTVTGYLDEDHNIGLVTAEAEKALARIELPAGYQLRVGGENEAIQDALGDLLLMVLLAVAFIYLIMVAQFQSLLMPLIVLTTVPLAFTGGLLALILFGKEVSVVAMLGFLILAGIIVNNGIVFIDCANQLRLDQGLEKRPALVAAGKMRMRPILMTALTTIFGMVPMAVSQQMSAELLQPMALVVVGGMVYATVLTLFFVPACYDLLQRRPLKKVEIREDLDLPVMAVAEE